MKKKADPLQETTVSSTAAYSGAFMQVRHDSVRLPDGSHSVREYILHPGATVIVACHDDGSLVLERQFRYALGRAFWEFPAGKLDAGEAPLACAQRELREETGLLAKNWRHLGVIHPCIGYSDERLEVFFASGLTQGEVRRDEGEFLEVHSWPRDKLQSAIFSGEITDAKTLAAFLLAQPLLDAPATRA